MLFNTIDFAYFFVAVFFIYWFIVNKNLKIQNITILIASYFFYGVWDWRFLSLIAFSTILDFWVGRQLQKVTEENKRKRYLLVSIIANLTLLGFFKYFNFFIESFVSTFQFLGFEISGTRLNIVLPVGISFYTFQTLSYTIDVYRKRIQASDDFVAFASFVSFFPQLVAGPIVRAKELLPQFEKKRNFSYPKSVNGMRQILWGLFKKVVIADNCAVYVNLIFENPELYSGSILAVGAVLFAFQIYGDFSGYSDMAIGCARLLGFDLPKNFAFPYFSRDIAEFWRRWHISLSTWFRDYVYFPLGGSRGSRKVVIRNVFIIFLISGFWHGAGWNFIIWGLLNAIYFLPLLILGRNRKNLDLVAQGRLFPSISEFVSIMWTFGLTCIAWIFFRSESLELAFRYLKSMADTSLFTIADFSEVDGLGKGHNIFYLLIFFLFIEWLGRANEFGLERTLTPGSVVTNDNTTFVPGGNVLKLMRWTLYAFIVFLIGMYVQTNDMPFIYFQF